MTASIKHPTYPQSGAAPNGNAVGEVSSEGEQVPFMKEDFLLPTSAKVGVHVGS